MTAASIEMQGRLHIRPIERLNLALSLAAVLAGLVLVSPAFAWAVGVGASLGTVNLRLLKSTSAHFFAGELGGGAVWVALFSLRFFALAVAIWFVFRAGVHPLGFVTGLLLSIPALFVGAWRMRPPVNPAAPSLSADDPEWDRWDPWFARDRDAQESEQ